MEAAGLLVLQHNLVARYESFLLSLLGSLEAILSAPNLLATSRRALSNWVFEKHAHALTEELANTIPTLVRDVFNEAWRDVSRALLLSPNNASLLQMALEEDVGEHFAEEASALVKSLSDQAHRDTMLARRYLREYLAEVGLLVSSGRHTERGARIAVRVHKQPPAMTFMDRAGRRWRTLRFVNVASNELLFRTYNEVFLYGLYISGRRVAHTNEDPPTEFAILDRVDNLPTYQELRESVFHPNSQVLVVATSVTSDV